MHEVWTSYGGVWTGVLLDQLPDHPSPGATPVGDSGPALPPLQPGQPPDKAPGWPRGRARTSVEPAKVPHAAPAPTFRGPSPAMTFRGPSPAMTFRGPSPAMTFQGQAARGQAAQHVRPAPLSRVRERGRG